MQHADLLATPARISALLTEQEGDLASRTDRLFARLAIAQWLVGLALALWVAPGSWPEAASANLLAAALLGGLVAAVPVVLSERRPARRSTRHAIAVAQALASVLIIHLTGGRIESHFHVFGSLVLLALYRDWGVIATASVVVVVDHALRGALWPESVFGAAAASGWRSIEHAAWIAFADLFLIRSCLRSRREMIEMATQRAGVESHRDLVETEVVKRTLELHEANSRMRGEISARLRAQAERDSMHAQLAQAQKMEAIGQLAAGIAHEINTPTQFVGDNARFLCDAYEDLTRLLREYEAALDPDTAMSLDEARARIADLVAEIDQPTLEVEVSGALEQSLDGVERIATIVRAMREFSHPSEATKELADINAAIRATVTVARNEWKYIAEVELDLDPNLPPVPCVLGELDQVVLNMVVNAAHAIAEKNEGGSGVLGTIRISTRDVDGWAEICIEDDGVGIPEAVQSKVYDPFFTTKKVGQGTGQGLALARGVVVNRHGGTIELASSPGIGTAFVIRLPMRPEAAAAA